MDELEEWELEKRRIDEEVSKSKGVWEKEGWKPNKKKILQEG